jgi:hypothetical protein
MSALNGDPSDFGCAIDPPPPEQDASSIATERDLHRRAGQSRRALIRSLELLLQAPTPPPPPPARTVQTFSLHAPGVVMLMIKKTPNEHEAIRGRWQEAKKRAVEKTNNSRELVNEARLRVQQKFNALEETKNLLLKQKSELDFEQDELGIAWKTVEQDLAAEETVLMEHLVISQLYDPNFEPFAVSSR